MSNVYIAKNETTAKFCDKEIVIREKIYGTIFMLCGKKGFKQALLYIFAITLLMVWLLEALVVNTGSMIHVLLVLSGVSLLLCFIRRRTME